MVTSVHARATDLGGVLVAKYPGTSQAGEFQAALAATRVVRVSLYASFEEMLENEDPIAIGGDLGKNPQELLAVIRSIYPPEKERLGVLAIGVEKTVP
ncbi:hypothetical protein [Nonomuraea helvata]|uniref:Uncharacterized protein n=1 Tax=Nonomuraea helvata TaxID=37484 RepID=A0ABV5SG24_9ACTN